MKKPTPPTDQNGKPLTKITQLEVTKGGGYATPKNAPVGRVEKPGNGTPRGPRSWEPIEP